MAEYQGGIRWVRIHRLSAEIGFNIKSNKSPMYGKKYYPTHPLYNKISILYYEISMLTRSQTLNRNIARPDDTTVSAYIHVEDQGRLMHIHRLYDDLHVAGVI